MVVKQSRTQILYGKHSTTFIEYSKGTYMKHSERIIKAMFGKQF